MSLPARGKKKLQHITFRTGHIKTHLEGSTIVSTLKKEHLVLDVLD